MTMLGGKLIKNPGARVPGRISHSPLDSPPPSLALFPHLQTHGQLTIIHPWNPLRGRGKYYSKAWMRDQIERKYVIAGF